MKSVMIVVLSECDIR